MSANLNNTGIAWTEKTLNPLFGCSKISAGCDHCYAETMATTRLKTDFSPRFYPERLEALNTRKGYMIFMDSMTDMFYEKHRAADVRKVFDAMTANPQHIYQILTKRPENMLAFFDWRAAPIPDNWWLGVTVENNAELHRLDTLRQIPAKHKFVSFEPLLEVIDPDLTGIDWVIAGGETGAGARLCDTVWLYDIWQKCQNEKRPFFFKQWGTKSSTDWPSDDDGYTVRDVKKALSAVESTLQFPAAMMQHLGRNNNNGE